MGDDLFHKRKARLAESYRREKAKLAPYERILIVCEGKKTEPHYFRGLLLVLRLHPANVIVEDKKSGLDPKSLVSRQPCNVVKNVVSFLHNQPGRIGYEEIHRDTYRRGT